MFKDVEYAEFIGADYARYIEIRKAEKLLDKWQAGDDSRDQGLYEALEGFKKRGPLPLPEAKEAAEALKLVSSNDVALIILTLLKSGCRALFHNPQASEIIIDLKETILPIPSDLKLPFNNHPQLAKEVMKEANIIGSNRALLAIEKGDTTIGEFAKTPQILARRHLPKVENTLYGPMFLYRTSINGLEAGLTYPSEEHPNSYLVLRQFHSLRALRNSVDSP